MVARYLTLIIAVLILLQINISQAREKPPIFYLTEFSSDPEYGRTEQKPIKVGGWKETGGHGGQRWFFKMLSGPNGEQLTIERVGVCCGYPNSEAYQGQALIDEYRVYIDKSKQPITLYLDSYEYIPPKIPVGFGTRVDISKIPNPSEEESQGEDF